MDSDLWTWLLQVVGTAHTMHTLALIVAFIIHAWREFKAM